MVGPNGPWRYRSECGRGALTPTHAPRGTTSVIQEPVQPTSSARPGRAQRRGARGATRCCWLGLIIAVLVARGPVAIAVGARSQDPDRDAGGRRVGRSRRPSAAPDARTTAQHTDKGRRPRKGCRLQGRRHRAGARSRSGRSADRRSRSATDDGWTSDDRRDLDTVITKGGQPIAVGDLHVGDQIRFSQTRNADGSYTITAIVVPTPISGRRGHGRRRARPSPSRARARETRVITVNDATVYKLGTAAGSKADVKVGVEVAAAGDRRAVTRSPRSPCGSRCPTSRARSSAKTADSITVKRRDGSTTVDPRHRPRRPTRSGDKDPRRWPTSPIGDRVEAEGTLRADGSLDAVSVGVEAARPTKAAQGAEATTGARVKHGRRLNPRTRGLDRRMVWDDVDAAGRSGTMSRSSSSARNLRAEGDRCRWAGSGG